MLFVKDLYGLVMFFKTSEFMVSQLASYSVMIKSLRVKRERDAEVYSLLSMDHQSRCLQNSLAAGI